jgi:tartrate dehydratase beta subunit/fumarate hydratase class I family protein
MTKHSFPFTEERIRALKAGDAVLISGAGFTGARRAGLASIFHWR